MKAGGLCLDGAATSAGTRTEEGRAGPRAGASSVPVPKEGGGRAKKISRAIPGPGEAASWARTTTASSLIWLDDDTIVSLLSEISYSERKLGVWTSVRLAFRGPH